MACTHQCSVLDDLPPQCSLEGEKRAFICCADLTAGLEGELHEQTTSIFLFSLFLVCFLFCVLVSFCCLGGKRKRNQNYVFGFWRTLEHWLGTDFQNFKAVQDKSTFRLSWVWPAYSFAQLSIQKQLFSETSTPQPWIIPPGGDKIALNGTTEFVLRQLQPGTKHLVRITPAKPTSNDMGLIPGQAVQMRISSVAIA